MMVNCQLDHHSYSSLVCSIIKDYYCILRQEPLATLPPEIDKPDVLMDIYCDMMQEQIFQVCTYRDEHHNLARAVQKLQCCYAYHLIPPALQAFYQAAHPELMPQANLLCSPVAWPTQQTKDPRLKYSPCIHFNPTGHNPGSTASVTQLPAHDDFPSDSSSSDSSSCDSDSNSSSTSSSCQHQKHSSQTKKHKSKRRTLCHKQAWHQKKVAKTTDFLFKCAKNWEHWWAAILQQYEVLQLGNSPMDTKLQNLLDLHSQHKCQLTFCFVPSVKCKFSCNNLVWWDQWQDSLHMN